MKTKGLERICCMCGIEITKENLATSRAAIGKNQPGYLCIDCENGYRYDAKAKAKREKERELAKLQKQLHQQIKKIYKLLNALKNEQNQ